MAFNMHQLEHDLKSSVALKINLLQSKQALAPEDAGTAAGIETQAIAPTSNTELGPGDEYFDHDSPLGDYG
jgi:hypothetical protein